MSIPAQKLDNLSNVGIVVNLMLGLLLFDLLWRQALLDLISTNHHSAKLIDIDRYPIASNAALLVNGSTWHVEPDNTTDEESGDEAGD